MLARNPPFFSVVIPIYNRLRFLQRALDSVLDQTFGDLEVIVVDDGSSEGDISQTLALSDSKVTLIRQTHYGTSYARNTGIGRSRGKWVAFLDSDDVWKKSHLATLYGLISDFETAGMVASSIVEIPESKWHNSWPRKALGKNPEIIDYFKESVRKALGKNPEIIDYFKESVRKNGVVSSSSVAIHRETIQRVGLFSPFTVGEDREYWARVALNTDVAKSYEITVAYLRSNLGTMETIHSNQLELDPPVPQKVGDLSPSINFLWSALRRDKIPAAKKESVLHYINASVDMTILRSIVGTRGTHISQLRKLYVTRWSRYLSIIRLISYSPPQLHRIIRGLSGLRLFCRRNFPVKNIRSQTVPSNKPAFWRV